MGCDLECVSCYIHVTLNVFNIECVCFKSNCLNFVCLLESDTAHGDARWRYY